MGFAVIHQSYADLRIGRQRRAIQLRVRYTAADAQRVVDQNLVTRGAILEHDLKARPFFWDAGTQKQGLSLYAKSKDRLEAGAIHPAARARIPRPTPAPDVRSDGIHVCGDDVRFNLVAVRIGACARTVDGVEE